MLPLMNVLPIVATLLAAGCACALAQTAAVPASQATPAPAKKAWFIRLIPPRPHFDKDLSEAEAKIMEQHFVYLKGLYEKGVCLFAGPVLDPKGVYGVMVIEAANEDEARAIAAADPSVKAGVNRIEVAEMRVAFPPKTH